MINHDHTTYPERRIALRLIAFLLREGKSISVYDGEEWTVKYSTNADEIETALATTGEDILRASGPGKDDEIVRFWLIWGNDEDLISDSSDSELAERAFNFATA